MAPSFVPVMGQAIHKQPELLPTTGDSGDKRFLSGGASPDLFLR